MSDEIQHLQMNVVVNIGDEQLQAHDSKLLSDSELPILPLRQMVLFPTAMIPAHLSRKTAIKLASDAEKKGQIIIVATQINTTTENPQLGDLYTVATAARVIKVMRHPSAGHVALLLGIARVEINEITRTKPYLYGRTSILEDVIPSKDDAEYSTMYDTLVERASAYAKYNTPPIPEDMIQTLAAMGPHRPVLCNHLCGSVETSTEDKMAMLAEKNVKERTAMLLRHLDLNIKQGELKADIMRRTTQDLDSKQRKHFLHETIRQIEKELGDSNTTEIANNLRNKAKDKKWPAAVADLFEREVSKLAMNDERSFDFNVQLNYLETLVGLPWGNMSQDNLDLKHAQRILDSDHYGLKIVKERIMEHLAVLRLRNDNKSPIICLVGPPGVGKTSLGKSIARSLEREYVRVSLGGVHDESEIRGHRRTYVGAMPGRIIKGLQRTSTDNPVFVLDEIDKIGGYSNNGDPGSALLEVLDPEQNTTFHDNYLDVDYDLSHVLFIATANTTSTIPTPLLDRMEVINISGYVTEEKIEIAKRHLIDKVKEECGMSDMQIKLNKATLQHLINNYTRESGVRGLEKKLSKLMRKLAVGIANGESQTYNIRIAELEDLIGKPDYVREDYEGNDFAGVVTGLAWTQVGGEILFIETSLSRGKGGKLTLTGNLGDVMKESAVIALEYIKAHAQDLNIDERLFEQYNIHVHVPEGATPKDGPSAGVTMITSMVSAMTQCKVRAGVAMTGEITLRGKVLPVGGIKEKILAAKRAGIKEIILCQENKRNVEKIEELYLKGLTFHYVNTIDDVLNYAILKERVKNPLVWHFDEKNSES